MTVLAACIFAASSLKAARIRASSARALSEAKKPHADLRNVPAPRHDEPHDPHSDFIRSLVQLRSLVRSALFSLSPGEGVATDAIAACRVTCERIVGLRLGKSALPQNAPQAADALLASLGQHIEQLNRLLRKKASASDISDLLIKVNTSARNLADTLAQASGDQTTLRFPVRKRQEPAGRRT